MYSRTALNDLLADLAADMPTMLQDPSAFSKQFETRSQQILCATAPADRAYVQGVLQAFVDRCGINDRFAA